MQLKIMDTEWSNRDMLAQQQYAMHGCDAVPNNLPIFPNPPIYRQQRQQNTSGINFMQLEWTSFDEFIAACSSQDELTIECRINVLKIKPFEPNPILYVSPCGSNNDEDIDESIEYEYESTEYDSNSKMKFEWNLNQMFIDKLLYNDNNGIMYHSDIYYDLFQLKVCRKSSDKYVWMIQSCGLPKQTTQIGVKFEIFANDGIRILSQIITFSYEMAIYDFNNEQNGILYGLLRENGTLILFCTANIIQTKRSTSSHPKRIRSQQSNTKPNIFPLCRSSLPCYNHKPLMMTNMMIWLVIQMMI